MEPMDLITSDSHKHGTVVAEQGDNYVIEHGLVRKHRHLLPRQFVHVVDGEARTTISKDLLAGAPEDEASVAAYYGLTPANALPPRATDDLLPGAGGMTNEGLHPEASTPLEAGQGRDDGGFSPGITGGDRFRDAKS